VLYLPFYSYGANAQKVWDMSGQGNHGVITGAVPGTYPMLQSVASGSVIQANIRISAVNGTAFVDFSAADVLTGNLDHLLVVKDSAGRTIQGYIKAAGTGETLGSELITGWTNHPDYPYSTFTSSGKDITSAIQLIDTTGIGYQVYVATIGQLIKCDHNLTLNSGTAPNWGWFPTAAGGSPNIIVGLSGGVNTFYQTMADAYGHVLFYSSLIINYSSVNSMKQVLTPSATGVTISSTKGGTENWESKDANFAYNDASGYTYAIYQVPGQRGSGWFADQVDDRIVHSSLNLGTAHTLHYWLLYRGFAGVIHGGATNYHGLRLTPTACSYNIGNTAVTVTHSAAHGIPVLFSIDRNGTSVDFYKNGVKIGSTQTLGANTAQVLTDFFRYSNSTIYWGGTIFEALAFNSNMGAQAIRNYFELSRSRYGV